MSINTRIGRQYDYYKNVIVPKGCHFIVRLDGNCFSGLTERNFKFPFDDKFYEGMKHAVQELMKEVPDIFKVHTHSDEISCYFIRESEWFNRRIEKITSITASIVSVAFSDYVKIPAHFDARVLITPNMEDIETYQKDRMDNAFRGCVNSYSFYGLVDEIGRKEATKQLEGMDINQRQELLFQKWGINIAKVPQWQRQGAFFEWGTFEKEGYNPITKETVPAIRRKIVITE